MAGKKQIPNNPRNPLERINAPRPRRLLCWAVLALLLSIPLPTFGGTNTITDNGITWEFDKEYPSGNFCNDRLMTLGMPQYEPVNQPSPFARAMWDKYRDSLGKSPWLEKGQILPTLNERFKDSAAKAPPDNE